MDTTRTPSTILSRALRARLTRLADAIAPAPGPESLVPVAEVSRAELRMAEGSLADVGLDPVVAELNSFGGDSRFRVLVARRDVSLAREVLAA